MPRNRNESPYARETMAQYLSASQSASPSAAADKDKPPARGLLRAIGMTVAIVVMTATVGALMLVLTSVPHAASHPPSPCAASPGCAGEAESAHSHLRHRTH